MTARSPRLRTSARIAATAAFTSAAASRLAPRRRAKARSNPGRRASSLSGMGEILGGRAEALDPAPHLLRPRLESGPVDDEAGRHFGNALELDEPVVAERPSGRDEIDDAAAEPEPRRQLHGAGELDALSLHPARGEIAPGDLRIFGGDADMAPAARIVPLDHFRGLGDGEMALADPEVEGRVDFGVVELHQHV